MEKNQTNQELPESIQAVENSMNEIVSSFIPEDNENKSIIVIVAEKSGDKTSSLNIFQGTNNLLYSSMKALLMKDDNLFEVISEAVKDAKIHRLIKNIASAIVESESEKEATKEQEGE